MMRYERKEKEQLPVLAICYDFDKTLTPDDMQAQGYIQSVGYDVEQFWEETNELAHAQEMDSNLAYMYKMVKEAEGNLILNKELVSMEAVTAKYDAQELHAMIERHVKETGSPRGKVILENWEETLPLFKKIVPNDYRFL